MQKAHPHYTIHELCRAFKISTSTYYYQCRQKPIDDEEQAMIETIKTIAVETNYSYRKRRMHASLLNKGFKLGVYRTATLMRKATVFAITPRKKHDDPNSGKSHTKAENILQRQFYPETINTHWVGDITFVRTHQGWSYLACVLDLASKEIVGWAMSKHPNAELAKQALRHVIRRQQPDTSQLLFIQIRVCNMKRTCLLII